MNHEKYMKTALEEAQKAYQEDEVPVGAVLVCADKIIAKAHNQRESKQSTISHAEIEVIKIANKKLKSWRLEECTLYVSLEPCMMCAGAIQQARVKRVVYATNDNKNGFMSQMMHEKGLNHYPIIKNNVLEKEATAILKKYFSEKRINALKIKEVKGKELKSYYALREEVFVKEQKVSLNEEYDHYDDENLENVKHIAAIKNTKVIGTMRLIYKREESILKVGRLAIKETNRKQGIGKKLLDYAEIQAKNNGINYLELGAQLSAKGFYESSMFKAQGSVFLDAGIEHITMIKKIKK